MRIAVAIATTGRPAVVAETLRRLGRQTLAPDRILVVGAGANDLPAPAPIAPDFPDVECSISPKGLTKQRNHALDRIGDSCDAVIFLDDDFFVAEDFVAGAAQLLEEHPEVVAASGHLLADGCMTAGVGFAEADALIRAYEVGAPSVPYVVNQGGAYGCNMVLRLRALKGLRFDEQLPLYGWLEDLDFTTPLRRRGRIVRTDLCVGVHLGMKSGRVPGLQLGYSQIANAVYLARKGSVRARPLLTMAAKNVLANALRSFKPEPWIDRSGRLAGNLLALFDLIRGRSHPLRVLDLAPAARKPLGLQPRT